MSSYENLSPQVITRIAREIQELARNPAPGAFWVLGGRRLPCLCVSVDLFHGALGEGRIITLRRSIHHNTTGIRLLQEHSESIAEIHAEIDGPGTSMCFVSCWIMHS